MVKRHSGCIYFTFNRCPGMIENPTGRRFDVNAVVCRWYREVVGAGSPASPLEVMQDRHGNSYVPLTSTLPGEVCLVTTCPSNTGAACELSRYDHLDGMSPARCSHRKFVLSGKK